MKLTIYQGDCETIIIAGAPPAQETLDEFFGLGKRRRDLYDVTVTDSCLVSLKGNLQVLDSHGRLYPKPE